MGKAYFFLIFHAQEREKRGCRGLTSSQDLKLEYSLRAMRGHQN